MRIRIAVLVAIVIGSGAVPALAQGDGIKMRGQWTITITDPVIPEWFMPQYSAQNR